MKNYHRLTRGGTPHSTSIAKEYRCKKIVCHALSVVNEKCNEITQVQQNLALLENVRPVSLPEQERIKGECYRRHLRLGCQFHRSSCRVHPILAESSQSISDYWPEMCLFEREIAAFRDCRMTEREPAGERRKWSRLPLGIPVFVRSRDEKGNECLEFATSLNVSAGGMLLAVRRPLRLTDPLRLEIPSAPVAATAVASVARTLEGRTLRVAPANGYYLLGIKFLRPLSLSNRASRKRKFVSSL